MPLAPGARLGPYRIVAPLGAGGMGEVYRAHDARLGRDVAIKVLPAILSQSPERLARFEHEARIVASLNHPSIVTLHSIEEADGVRFLTMELVEGCSLDTRIGPGGMPVDDALSILIPLADALAAGHAKGIVHRDLKPANIMLTDDGRVKVLDYGVAKRAVSLTDSSQPTTGHPLSAVGEVLGTVPYMAPEQVFGESVDGRTDIFATGILAFEMLTGSRPFAGRTLWETSGAIIRDAPPSLTTVRADVPESLAGIVARCLEKQPTARFQRAEELAQALRAVSRGSGRVAHAVARAERVASVAVLPFVNRGGSVDDQYFSDGLADELLGLLARIHGLRVSARASSFQFRDTTASPAEIGRSLGVDTFVDGSVRRAGNRVRISVQLVDAADGASLWAESYDRTLDDIFAVQDEIAGAVVRELRSTLLGEERDSGASGRARADVREAARGRSRDPEAHRLYLLARHAMDQLTRPSTARAIVHLQQALERDPAFALAWTELSVAFIREVGWLLVPADQGLARARSAVARALELEPALADAHVQLAWLRIFCDWDWAGAQDSLARALALAPGSASATRLSGVLASVLGRTEEAIGIHRRALEQDPLSAAAYHSLGLALAAVDDHSGAEGAFRRALELAPQRIATHAQLALVLLAQRRFEDARREADQEPETGYRLWAQALVCLSTDEDDASQAALQQLIDEHSEGWAVQVAEVCTARRDVDAAFTWLERAHRKRDTGLAGALTSPRLRGLHHDPRWPQFLERMGFVPNRVPGS